MSTMPGDLNLRDYLSVLRRRWLLVLVGILLGIGGGVAVIKMSPVSWSATTSVLVQPTELDTNNANGRTNEAINLDTEAQLVRSMVVARLVDEELDSSLTPRELAKKVSVGVPANTSVLTITYTDSSREGAVKGSQAFADAYLANRTEAAEQRLEERIEKLRTRISDLSDELKEVTAQLAEQPEGEKDSLLTTQRQLLVDQIQTSTSQLNPLITQEVVPGHVITAAQQPSRPDGLSKPIVLTSGLFLGLLIGICLAFARDRQDHHIRERRDLEQLGLDVLVNRFTLSDPTEMLCFQRASTESLRRLRNALLAVMPRHRGTLTVASASADVSGSATAACLATTLARSGIETVLVSANTHKDTLTGLHGLNDGPGLADVLRSGRPVVDCLHHVPGLPRLSVVPSGADGGLFSELLEAATLRPVIDELQQLADVVVLDVAPTSVNADSQTVVPLTRGLLLVTTAGVSTSDEVVDAMTQLRHVNASLLGSVVVEIAPPSRPRTGPSPHRREDDADAPADIRGDRPALPLVPAADQARDDAGVRPGDSVDRVTDARSA